GRVDVALAADPLRKRIVLFGGLVGATGLQNETWEDGPFGASLCAGPTQCWRQHPAGGPGARHSPAMVYDALRRQMVLLCGTIRTQASGDLGGCSATSAACDDTWTFDGKAWSQVNLAGYRPGPRTGMGLAYDPFRARTMLFGGQRVGGIGG